MSIVDLLQMSNLPEAVRDAIWGLFCSGHAMAQYLLISDGSVADCVCGIESADFTNPLNHRRENGVALCPVGRFYEAVNEIERVVVPADKGGEL